MALYLASFRSSARFAEDVVAGIVFLWARLVAKGSTVDELLVGDLVDVTSASSGPPVVDGG
jgi:hypothetical protein